MKVASTDFAVDLALLAGSITEAKQIFESLEESAKSVGLHFNEAKTKYIR